MSYSRASQELFLTQSAVSHQIKLLESSLGTRLFRRSGRAMLLTDNGQRFYAQVREGLARLAKGVAELRANANQQTLNISVVPSFAAGWLVPRLSDFYRRHPQIDVNLRATTALADFGREDLELAIRAGLGVWQGLKAEKLLQAEMFPVCSPDYRDGRLPRTARELLECVLLHITDLSWEEWFKSAGVPVEAPLRGPRFDSDSLAIRAAESGQGVVLARSNFVEDELKKKRLVRLVQGERTLRTPFAYYLVYPENTELPQKAQMFRNWLLEQFKE
jgi:LysR family glycine cleavage system transcriptional activator